MGEGVNAQGDILSCALRLRGISPFLLQPPSAVKMVVEVKALSEALNRRLCGVHSWTGCTTLHRRRYWDNFVPSKNFKCVKFKRTGLRIASSLRMVDQSTTDYVEDTDEVVQPLRWLRPVACEEGITALSSMTRPEATATMPGGAHACLVCHAHIPEHSIWRGMSTLYPGA